MTLHFNQVECPSKSFAAKLNYSLLATSDFSKYQFHKRNRTWAKFFGRCSSSFDEWCWKEQCGHCSHYTLCIILRVGEWVLKVVGVFTLHQTVCNSKVISHLFRICKTEAREGVLIYHFSSAFFISLSKGIMVCIQNDWTSLCSDLKFGMHLTKKLKEKKS